MQFKALLSLCFLLFLANVSICQNGLFSIENKKVFIEGNLRDLVNLKSKSGQLSFFDTVTGLKQRKKFNIDQNGKFQFEIDLLHAVYGNAVLEFDETTYLLFLKPNERYKLEIGIDDLSLKYLDGTGKLSQEVMAIKKLLWDNFESDFKRQSKLHDENLSIENALKFHKDLEAKVMQFIDDYSNKNTVSKQALAIFKNEYKYNTASAWAGLRYEYKGNKRRLRKDLPNDFFIQLHNEYPVNVNDAFASRKYADYIRAIGTILSTPKQPNLNAKINFFRNAHLFSEKELQLIKAVYSGDKSVARTTEYDNFFNDQNARKIEQLNKQYDVNRLLLAVRQFPKGIGRDLIISQYISRKYFRETFINPSKEEWKDMEALIQNQYVMTELKRLATNRNQAYAKQSSDGASPAYEATPTVESVTKKYLDPHKGKVIYIDFWATWCGPCRKQEPYAAKLHKEFKKDNVVFLNLCCQSKEAIWSKYIKEKDLHGVHYLLNNAEFRLFAEMYGLKGFPTYILIDQQGKVRSKDAYWPSDSKRVIRQIDRLLK